MADLLLGGLVFVVAYVTVLWVPSFLGATDPVWRWIALAVGLVSAGVFALRLHGQRHRGPTDNSPSR